MVQNTRSLKILGEGLEALIGPPPTLAGKRIDDLFDEYSKLLETVQSFNIQR